MSESNEALIYAFEKFMYNVVRSCIEKNTSLEDMLNYLKTIGLYEKDAKEETLKSYIYTKFFLSWDDKNNKWERPIQVDMFDFSSEAELSMLINDIVTRMSDNDKNTLLKDMDEVLTDLKTVISRMSEVASGIAKVTKDIDRITKTLSVK